jgi:hypothetical protein
MRIFTFKNGIDMFITFVINSNILAYPASLQFY